MADHVEVLGSMVLNISDKDASEQLTRFNHSLRWYEQE